MTIIAENKPEVILSIWPDKASFVQLTIKLVPMQGKMIQIKYIKLLLLISVSKFVFGQKNTLHPTREIQMAQSAADCKSRTVFPKKNRTYNEFVGNYAIKYGFALAEGWRRDSCNGGYGKGMGCNPYLDFIACKFIKTDYGSNFVYFYYKRGKKYTGRIKEKFNLLGSRQEQEIIFRARCRNGKLHGKGTLTISETKELVGECFFENGELVGTCKSWDAELHIETRTTYVKGSLLPLNSTTFDVLPKK